MNKKAIRHSGPRPLPGILIALTFAWLFPNWLHTRRLRRRLFAMGILTCLLIIAAGLSLLSKWQSHAIPEMETRMRRQEQMTQSSPPPPLQSQKIASGNEPDRQTALKPVECANTPPASFTVNCADCHGSCGQGGEVGPSLIGVSAKHQRGPRDLKQLLNRPHDLGLADPMPDSFPNLSTEEKRQIIEWLSKL